MKRYAVTWIPWLLVLTLLAGRAYAAVSAPGEGHHHPDVGSWPAAGPPNLSRWRTPHLPLLHAGCVDRE